MKTQRDDNQYGIEAIPTGRPRPSITPTSTTPTSSSGSCRCGISVETRLLQYPWQVALVARSGNRVVCGGSLISSRSVLTAAHCNRVHHSNIAVIVGGKKISVTSWISHPDYDRETADNDIAIIILARDVRFSDTVSPVCLPWNSYNSYDNRRATVAGWGSLKRGRSHANREEDVYTMTNNRCKYDYPSTWSSSFLINSDKICAASSKHPTCPGDSGGPMVILEDGAFTLIGVHSSGLRCAQDAQPGVYSRVTSYLDWIMMEISGETCQRN